jgi:hypothetical protein
LDDGTFAAGVQSVVGTGSFVADLTGDGKPYLHAHSNSFAGSLVVDPGGRSLARA